MDLLFANSVPFNNFYLSELGLSKSPGSVTTDENKINF